MAGATHLSNDNAGGMYGGGDLQLSVFPANMITHILSQPHTCTHVHTGELVAEVNEYLLKLPSPVSLATLANLEKHVVQSTGVADFSSLCCGSFLSLVSGHEVLLSQLSGGVVGPQASGTDMRKRKMLRIVHQLGHQLKCDEVSLIAFAPQYILRPVHKRCYKTLE